NVTLVFHGEARRLSGATTVSGKDSAVRWLADWFSRFGRDYSMTIDEVRDLDRGILVVTRHRATGRQSGASIDEKTAQIMLVNDGQIVRQEFFSDRDEALKAAGLSE
ncbi:MAG: hypothetical protein M3Q53_00825, partial [Actinomycetota bacterium]|nr:hypothetical protein [Actinomycetota bacterium]